MRITRLKLVNFIGIKSGMNKDEIEIFFPDNDNKFTLINGDNGCGKSTILSMLHPFKDSFDDRKELTYGDEGLKEIDIQSEEAVYKIRHFYGKHSASFIEKDGVELNPNGGVRSFEDIVKLELGITKDYFNIGKIGSNTENFVHFSTTQRKAYISNFVQEVEKYFDKFDIVSGKYKLDSDKLKSLAKDLVLFEDPAVIENRLKTSKERVKELEKSILDTSNNAAVLASDINYINDKLGSIDYMTEKANYDQAFATREDNLKKILILEDALRDIEKCKKDIDNLEKMKTALSEKRLKAGSIQAEITRLSNRRIEANNSRLQAEYKLNGITINSEDTIESLNESVSKSESRLKELEELINTSEFNAYCKDGDVNNIPVFLNKYDNFMRFILSSYNELKNDYLIPGTPNIELFFKKDCGSTLKSFRDTSRTAIEETSKLKEEKIKENSFKCANLDKLDILKNRPVECTIDKCPFIADALKYKNLPEEIETLEGEINKINSSLKDLDEKAEKISDVINLFKTTVSQYTSLDAQNNIIYHMQSKKYGSVTQLFNKTLNELQSIYDTIRSAVEDYLNNINEYISLKVSYERNKSSLDQLKNSKNIIEHYENEIKYYIAEEESIKLEIKEKTNEFKTINDEITYESAYINNLDSYSKLISENDKLNKYLSEVKKALDKYEELSASKTEKSTAKMTADKLIIAYTNEKVELDKSVIDDEIALRNITELKRKEEELHVSYETLSIIKDALDPRFGIPLIYVQAYLGKTEIIANELLNLAFNGKFEIHFESGPKDFFIQVRTGDSVKSDIKYASQGEVALTTISISLALIEQSIEGFNILSLDEIDGPLDSGNREAFINILASQVNKLGIEQVFIISHNDAFDSVPMNIIALPGSEQKLENDVYMQNKVVIYNYSD